MKRVISLALIIVLCCIAFAGCGTDKENGNTKASTQIINLADDTVKSLKEKLKTPSSLHINNIVVSETSGKSSGNGLLIVSNDESTGIDTYLYTIYIDYSAENSIGENTKAYFSASYFVSGDDLKTLDTPHEVSGIPQLSGTVYEISTSDLKSYSDTLK